MKASWSIAVMLMGSVVALSQNTFVRARLDSSLMVIGDPNRLVVTVTGATDPVRVDWSPLDTMEKLIVLDQSTSSETGQNRELALPFSVYDSVGLLFPQLPVYIGNETLYTNDVALVVDFAAVDSTLNPYRGLREEEANLSDYMGYILGGVLACLVLATAAYFFFFAKRKSSPPPPPPPADPPHVVALARLAKLAKQTQLDDKTYYSRLDHILRSYLEARYEVPALERTSREVAALLEQQGLQDTQELNALLAQVDLVKFAKAELPVEHRAASLQRVEAFVRASIPPSPVQAEQPHGKSA